MNNLTPEQINQLLKYAIGGYWSALQPKLYEYEIISPKVKELLKDQLDYQEQFQAERQLEEINGADPHTIVDYMRTKEENKNLKENLNQKEAELTTERATTQQAFQTSQTWHERQKAEIIAQWKTKLQTFINQRKSQLHQEIQLIKEALHE